MSSATYFSRHFLNMMEYVSSKLSSQQNWVLSKTEFSVELDSKQNWVFGKTEFLVKLTYQQNQFLRKNEFLTQPF